ncbi:hypothetical protein [Formosa haliotis]|uniref:hypothetical protein n=1 Tax=Formosa haliotis TaxID=1555194 RepID=UPI0008244B40|nr:hypothetical protein [Formosa haliotis]
MKRVTIISTSPLGYVNYIIDHLKTYPNVEVTYINYSSFRYKYKSASEKVKNAFNKLLFKKNIKEEYKSNCLMSNVISNPEQDIIFIVRPDRLKRKDIVEMRAYTKKLYAFYYDSTKKVPEQADLVQLFDKVFSYEQQDVKTYKLHFITNYIYDYQAKVPAVTTPKVFNVSSFDERFKDLKQVAAYLKSQGIGYTIMVSRKRAKPDPLVTMFSGFLSLQDVKLKTLESSVVLDIQKEGQKGLSFRVFEAMGYHKKLITTNADIVNYDFYNPNNIYVLDVNQIDIPRTFFDTPYQEIPLNILYKYTLNGWVEHVLGIAPTGLDS